MYKYESKLSEGHLSRWVDHLYGIKCLDAYNSQTKGMKKNDNILLWHYSKRHVHRQMD